VVCWAPRAREESVRPRRPAGVVVRPLNFTVRRPICSIARLQASTQFGASLMTSKSNSVVVRFRWFRSFLIAAFLLNGGALFFFNPGLSFLVAFLSVCGIVGCISCPRCGKSPYILKRGPLRIGSPIPERICSRCGQSMIQAATDLAA